MAALLRRDPQVRGADKKGVEDRQDMRTPAEAPAKLRRRILELQPAEHFVAAECGEGERLVLLRLDEKTGKWCPSE